MEKIRVMSITASSYYDPAMMATFTAGSYYNPAVMSIKHITNGSYYDPAVIPLWNRR